VGFYAYFPPVSYSAGEIPDAASDTELLALLNQRIDFLTDHLRIG